jgi:lipoprotein NlpD
MPAVRWLAYGCTALAVAGCGSFKTYAPVEERPVPSKATANGGENLGRPVVPMGLENAGKAGYYTVRPGDTLIRIGLETGQNWRDLQRWNNLDRPNLIEIGQVLRVLPPGQDPSSVAVRPVVSARADSRPLDPKASAPQASAASAVVAPVVVTPVATPTPAPASTPVAARDADEDLNWVWPAQGALVSSFDETRNKGVAIAGKAGDPVFAAADGKVVYAGSGLRGYGNLIIVKHNETFLTAYAHNQTLLVKEDQPVRRGQKIAEMGSSDSERVQLHFEIRRRGKPIDPTRLLPAR